MLYVTTGFRLIALNAKTGAMVQSFGEGGVVDLKKGAVVGKGQQIDLETGEIGLHSPPTVINDVVIVGSAFFERAKRLGAVVVPTVGGIQNAGGGNRGQDREGDRVAADELPASHPRVEALIARRYGC